MKPMLDIPKLELDPVTGLVAADMSCAKPPVAAWITCGVCAFRDTITARIAIPTMASAMVTIPFHILSIRANSLLMITREMVPLYPVTAVMD